MMQALDTVKKQLLARLHDILRQQMFPGYQSHEGQASPAPALAAPAAAASPESKPALPVGAAPGHTSSEWAASGPGAATKTIDVSG